MKEDLVLNNVEGKPLLSGFLDDCISFRELLETSISRLHEMANKFHGQGDIDGPVGFTGDIRSWENSCPGNNKEEIGYEKKMANIMESFKSTESYFKEVVNKLERYI